MKHASLREKMIVFVSYVPRLKRFSAHRTGLDTVTAPSVPELRARLAEVCGGAAVRLRLSKVARAEVARRRGEPVAVGWT
jgi:hypothetical protein